LEGGVTGLSGDSIHSDRSFDTGNETVGNIPYLTIDVGAILE
jgi:hypothetical protein